MKSGSMPQVMLAPGKLPGNEYAFKNALFLNPADYAKFSKSSRTCYVQVKQFVLTL